MPKFESPQRRVIRSQTPVGLRRLGALTPGSREIFTALCRVRF